MHKWLLSSFLTICMVLGSVPLYAWDQCEETNMILHAEHLNPVFECLHVLENEGNGNVNILHIGDSHIQGNYLTDKIRRLFYADFGQGSRGLVFPFQVAGTNSPVDIISASRFKWDTRKNTQPLYCGQIGICGRILGNRSPFSSLRITISAAFSDFAFDEVTIFYSQVNKSGHFLITDINRNPLTRTSRKYENGFVADKYKSSSALTEIVLHCNSLPNLQGSSFLQGIYLKSSKRNGVTYNVSGVNGSQYRNWAASKVLSAQSTYLQPQLIIISLGTNDANDPSLTTDQFTDYLDKLVKNLRKANPEASFLLTTPSDSFYKQLYPNQQVDRIRQAILLYSERNQLACWDLYAVMGGQNSILEWQKEGLASRDLIHFTKEGYLLQGELFYKAFINHYTSYVTHRSK